MSTPSVLGNLLHPGRSQDPPPRPRPRPDSGELVTDAHRIGRLLDELRDQRILITVQVRGLDTPCSSSVLKVDAEHGVFALDELRPDAGHRAVNPGTTLRVTGQLQGVRTTFTSTVHAVGTQGGVAFYRLPFPAEVHYNQRREHYRVKLGPSQSLQARFTLPDGRTIEAPLADLSQGGLNAHFDGDVDRLPSRGERFCECVLQLGEEAPIVSVLEVRHVRTDPSSGKVHLGGRFVGLERADLRRLQRLIAELDRVRLKKRHELTG